MRFGADILLKIVDFVREGLVEGKDISQSLRELEVESHPEQEGILRLVPRDEDGSSEVH